MMRLRSSKLARLGAVVITALALFATPALAQEKEEKPFEEPGIAFLPRSDPYIQWIAGTVIVAACLFVAFKNPHRTHLD
jgi:hypothetical protein